MNNHPSSDDRGPSKEGGSFGAAGRSTSATSSSSMVGSIPRKKLPPLPPGAQPSAAPPPPPPSSSRTSYPPPPSRASFLDGTGPPPRPTAALAAASAPARQRLKKLGGGGKGISKGGRGGSVGRALSTTKPSSGITASSSGVTSAPLTSSSGGSGGSSGSAAPWNRNRRPLPLAGAGTNPTARTSSSTQQNPSSSFRTASGTTTSRTSSYGSLSSSSMSVSKKQLKPPPSSSTNTTRHHPHLEQVSEFPMILRVKNASAVYAASSDLAKRSSLRVPKRQRPTYLEANESDSDDYLFDDDIHNNYNTSSNGGMPKSKKPRKDGADVAMELEDGAAATTATTSGSAGVGADGTPLPPNSTTGEQSKPLPPVDGPPPGELSTLWYSREDKLHLYAAEKICGWKTRPLLGLVDEYGNPAPLDSATATKIQSALLHDELIWAKRAFRMELSRVAPSKCPAVLAAAALDDARKHPNGPFEPNIPTPPTTTEPSTTTESATTTEPAATVVPPPPSPGIPSDPSDALVVAAMMALHTPGPVPSSTAPVDNAPQPPKPAPTRRFLKVLGREEVLLVKWRGRSYLHCSWERASDIARFDSSNNTARNKVKRFYLHQEAVYGPDWKKVLQEEQSIHHVDPTLHRDPDQANANAVDDPDEERDDYFSPQNLEVERIVACDESTMNMGVLARQRGINMQAEQDAVRRREEEVQDEIYASAAASAAAAQSALPTATPDENEKAVKTLRSIVRGVVESEPKPWDPEDNVRYVVKWKGLPFAEMTWEYWRDIKRDAVDEAEDFWYRQQPPDPDQAIRAARKPHPHMREFRKLQESPSYGVSSRKRPVEGFEVDEEEETNPGFNLRSYQLEGVNWLLFNWWNRRSPILADEMGLGKTIQTVAFLRELQTQPATQVQGPFLIVAPLSLIGQWQSELASWAPDINVVLYHGSADARDFLVQHEFYYSEQFIPKPTAVKLRKNHITKFHVLITTYEVVLKDVAVLSKIRWRALIVDEAHRLKNSKSKLFEELATVPRDYCLLLTGTPIANATEELWALLNFANPTVFDDKDGFLEKFGSMTDAKQVNELHSLLKPYLLRRVKDDVEKSLPPKEETILEVSLTPIQKTYYKAIYERNTSFLYKGSKPSNAPSLMNVMMELRKCCNHPYLVKGAEERILADAAAKLADHKDEHGNAIPIDHTNLFAEQLVKSSGKMVLMEKLLQKLFVDGHKVLIFSQMVRALDLLEELLKLKRYRYERLDGSTSSSSRAHAVDRFNRKSMQRFVMLLSTRAGGLGLNLTAADIVIIFDSDFNPQNDLQAMARAHRIGQTRAVQVFRLLTSKTYEMHMFHSASLKLGLERAVLSQNRDQGDESDDKAVKNKSEREAQAREIDVLLKKGAYDVFRDDDDREAEKFMETDIDQLLESSAKKVTYGASATSSLGGGLGSFSKASFVANTGDGEKDVDLDDPDFWSKAVGLEVPVEMSEEVAAMIDDGIKRSRKQVQVYDPYADTVEAEKMKKERLALEKMLEKEEKDRLKMEKKLKKKEAKDRKKREKEVIRLQQQAEKKAAAAAAAAAAVVVVPEAASGPPTASTSTPAAPPKPPPEPVVKKVVVKEPKPKKSKKSDRQRALRLAEYEDPVIERIKQAWEVPQRAKATAAAIRFGFGRFCKIRNESNLTSLPLQDLEIFVRCYVFQVALQVAVILLARLNENPEARELRPLFKEWLGIGTVPELDWICDSVQSVMELYLDVEGRRRFLRMPLILAEPTYVDVLRQGAGFRALRRLGFLARLNRIIESCIDSILSSLGHEELGKRGCTANDLPTLEVDLKARYVTTEELALAISSRFRVLHVRYPASWWDRSCDIGLVVGTFVHGLGNYEAIRNDFDLPFADKLRRIAQEDEACYNASHVFRVAAQAVRRVFDDALEAVRIKAELEVQAAVAAAAKAASKREEDAALLRKGGAAAEVVASSMPDTQVENAFEFDGTDSHFVTLPRMHSYVCDAVRKEAVTSTSTSLGNVTSDAVQEAAQSEDAESHNDDLPSDRVREHQTAPMPDARVLDHRLLLILKEMEYLEYGDEVFDTDEPNPDLWRKTDDVLTNLQVRAQALARFFNDPEDRINEYSGVGLGGNQCGTSHRTLNDGSDFAFGSASSLLSQVAYGTDAPRYLRAIGVPMNITRFAVSGVVYSEPSWVKSLIETENFRFYGEPTPSKGLKETSVKEEKMEDASERGTGTGDTEMVGSSPEKPRSVGHSAEDPAKAMVTPINPEERMPAVFRENAQLRAHICLAVAFYGFPSSSDEPSTVAPDLWAFYLRQSAMAPGSLPSPSLFNDVAFRDVVVAMAPDVEVPDCASIRGYVEGFLLPHCLRFCINGNGPTTRGARGSQGEYETAFGVSLHPEPSDMHPSPLPDPCLSLQEHSMEALGLANAMLRRVRLLRTCSYISSGGVSVQTMDALLRSFKHASSSIQDLPVWWCPWVHDVALMVLAAMKGLFSVIPDRVDDLIFSPKAVQRRFYTSLAADPSLHPSAPVPSAVRQSTPEQLRVWTERQAAHFPSMFQLERRLAFLCSQATKDVPSEVRFDCIPMFDHGGWPRN